MNSTAKTIRVTAYGQTKEFPSDMTYAEIARSWEETSQRRVLLVNEDGSRLHEGQYLSTKPQWNRDTNTYMTENGEVVFADAIDPNAEDKNLKRTDVEQPQQTTQQTNNDGTVG